MQMPIPDDWDGESTCEWAVCWPNSPKWKAILYGLIESPNQGRFWDFDTGDFLALREQFKPIYDYNFNLKEVIMACSDNVANALNNIASAILQMATNSSAQSETLNNLVLNNTVCCEQTLINQGGFISGGVTQDSGESVPVYGSQPPKNVVPGQHPEGYETESEYLLDKCQMANLITDGFIGTLRNLAAIGVFQGVALAGLIVASILTGLFFPPAAIPIAAAAIGLLSVNVTILAVVANEVEENRAEWVCIFYENDNVEEIITLIADALDAIIATLETTGPIGFAIKQICLVLLNADTLNGLMEKRAHLDYPDADCSGCDEPTSEIIFEFVEDAEGWGQGACDDAYAWDAAFSGSLYWVTVSNESGCVIMDEDGLRAAIGVEEGQTLLVNAVNWQFTCTAHGNAIGVDLYIRTQTQGTQHSNHNNSGGDFGQTLTTTPDRITNIAFETNGVSGGEVWLKRIAVNYTVQG